jgi:hypothetical protein
MEAIHWTSSEIKDWKNSGTSREQIKTGMFGKPIGFWYAYDDDWKAIASRNSILLKYKYVFHLKEDDFTTSVKSNPQKILKLNHDNLVEFIETYWDDDLYDDNSGVFLGRLKTMEKWFSQTSSSRVTALQLLNKYSNKNWNNDNNNNNDNNDNNANNANSIIKNIQTKWQELPINQKRKYEFSRFDWIRFWKGVSDDFAGVEFDPDLFTIHEISLFDNSVLLDLSWIQDIEILSGVIFKANTFFKARDSYPVLAEIIKGGKRKTRKYKKHIRQKKSVKRRLE